MSELFDQDRSPYAARRAPHKAADMPHVVFINRADVAACRTQELADRIAAMLEQGWEPEAEPEKGAEA